MCFNILGAKRKNRQVMASVVGISLLFMVCGVPILWNKFRQLLMKYSYHVVQMTQKSGTGTIFNYEYYIVNFVLTFNNCVNFYVYMLCGSTWRKGFVKYIKGKLC